MIKLIRKLSQPIVWRIYKWYLSGPHWYHYNGIQVRILPTVFHPGWLVSTKTLLSFLAGKELKGKKILELGAGSGLISLFATSQGAISTASDINPFAVQAMRESAKKNNLTLSIIESDLFAKVEPLEFDYILINPPYFPKDPLDNWDRAFFCGSNFEYFHNLFAQIFPFLREQTHAFMILNEYCNIEIIESIAGNYKIGFMEVYHKRKSGEIQYIFELNMNTI